jgi:hypothetical protein
MKTLVPLPPTSPPSHLPSLHTHVGEKALLGAQRLAAVAHRAPEHATQHEVPPLVPGPGAVGDGEGERADVVGNHTVGHVLAINIVLANLPERGGRGM